MPGDYFDLDETKHSLTIIGKQEDDFLNEKGEKSEQKLEDLVYDLSPSLPLTDDQKTSAREFVNADVCVKYLVKTKDYEGAKEWRTIRDEAKTALLEKLASSTQQRLVSLSKPYLSDPLASE